MGEPPLLAGAAKVTVACALPALALTPVGAPGTAAGVTAFEGLDAAPVPAALVAFTVNVYETPFVRPVTTCEVPVLPALLSTPPTGLDVTAYPVIGEPPLLAGAAKVTVACALPAVALTVAGAPGTPAGVTAFDGL